MGRRLLLAGIYLVACAALLGLESQGVWAVHLSPDHTLWGFAATVCALLALHQTVLVLISRVVRRRSGPEGEIKMLSAFVRMMTGFAVVLALLYFLGTLKAIGAVAAGFAGMLLGWSLQAPVSGFAAWIMVTLKRPFRIGDRVLFPSLGLLGDAKQVGLMYTVLDQVGGSIGSEEAIGRDILIPNAMLFNQVAINYTPKAQAAYFLDEVVIRITYDSDWDAAEQIMLTAARSVTADIMKATGEAPYIRSDVWDYGIFMRLRYMTMAKDRPRITHEIIKQVFKAVQHNPKVDMAIPYVYSFRKSTDGTMRGQLPGPEGVIQEIQIETVTGEGMEEFDTPEVRAEAEQLADSIREHGLLQPIIVTPSGPGHYRIVAGHKRFLACRHLRWRSVPVVIRPPAAAAPGAPDPV